MKDKNRPVYHCDVCMAELIPIKDDEVIKDGVEVFEAHNEPEPKN
jgi:hypothetical protein